MLEIGVGLGGIFWFVRQIHWSFVFSIHSWGACLWGLKIKLPGPFCNLTNPPQKKNGVHVLNMCEIVCKSVAWQLNLRRTWSGFPISPDIDVRPLKTTPLITAICRQYSPYHVLKSCTCLLPPVFPLSPTPSHFFHFHFIYVSCVFWLIVAWLWKFKHDEPGNLCLTEIWLLCPTFSPPPHSWS